MNTAKKDFFRELESASAGDEIQFTDMVENLAFNDAGLLPAIAQDVETGEVLMLAWMNREALETTIATGNMTYWSRSRQSLWIKGETSGHYQEVKSISFDCDGDTILCQVKQQGSACHTHRKTCFYLQLDENGNRIVVSSSSGK